jgi:hypothetical protein
VHLPHFSFLFRGILRLLFKKIALVAYRLITIFAYVTIMAGFLRFLRDSYHVRSFDGRDSAIEVD